MVVAQVLNRGADEVLKWAAKYHEHGPVSVVTAEVTSIIDPDRDDDVEDDVDEAVWEEMETGLRHQGRVTTNFLALMAIGGAVAVIGLVSDPVPQAIAFVASGLIAPGFEPIAKIPLGAVLGRPNVIGRGLVSMLAGYAVLVATAALTFYVLRAVGATTIEALAANPEIEKIAHPTALELTTSGLAATAGVLMLAAYRRSVIAGALMALILIPAAALIGAGLISGRFDLAREGLERFAVDALLIVLFGALVVWVKQVTVHRRKPMV